MISWGLEIGLKNSMANWKFIEKTVQNLSIFLGSTEHYLVCSEKEKKDEFDFLEDEEKLKSVLGCGFLEELAQKRDFFILA